jgi:hypothetical protein
MGVATVGALRFAAPKNDVMAGYQRSWIFVIVAAVLACAAMPLIFQRPTAAQIEDSR